MPRARLAKANNRGSASEANATGEDVLEHHPVPRERVERMLERRRPVLLEEEVPHPGEAVAAHQRAKQPPGIAGHDRHRHQRQHAAAADEMQPPRGAVGVLAQVERVELAEAGEAGHGGPPVTRSEEHTSELPSLMRNSYAV